MIVAIALSLFYLGETCSSNAAVSKSQGDANKLSALHFIWPVLKSSGAAARVYYSASCQKDDDYPIPFPRLSVQPPKDARALHGIEHIFRKDSSVTLAEKKSGVFDIVIGKVPDELLRTRITKLTLTLASQYDPYTAIRAIETTPEFHSAVTKLKLERVTQVTNMPVRMPAPGLQHLPSSIENVTVDEALDSVAKTFQVVVLYGYCEPPSTFQISIVGQSS